MIRSPLIVALGASTGGPQALQSILSSLPRTFPAVIFVIQHMPIGFTEPFARRLANQVALPVKECREDGEVVQSGHIYIAQSGVHLGLTEDQEGLRIFFPKEPELAFHKPSIDVFFRSLITLLPTHEVRAALLTGMGRDGARGLRELREKGGITAVQAEQDCVVFGMPKAALAAFATDTVLTLPELAAWIRVT